MIPQLRGLTESEATQRAAAGKSNKQTNPHAKTAREIILENSLTIFNLINFGIIALLFVIFLITNDDRLLLDSVGTVIVVVVNTVISIVQEFRTREILSRTRLMLERDVIVVREGVERQIPQERIVEGDVVKIGRGDFAAVDGEVLASTMLEMDESLLTGESLTIEKPVGAKLFSGSFCVSGSGYYVAERVGAEAYAAKISRLAKEYKFVSTPLQKKVDQIFIVSFIIAMILAAIEVISHAAQGTLLDVEFIRRVATLVITLLPEGLVFFTTVVFAAGVYRVMKMGAVVQKLNAIESFSTVEAVCLDKTGTLTENQLAVQSVLPINGLSPSDVTALLGAFAKASSDSNATILALRQLPNEKTPTVLEELPFSSARKFSALKLKLADAEATFALGAIELLESKLTDDAKAVALNAIRENGLTGYRNLLFAELPENAPLSALAAETALMLKPLAVVSLTGPIRADAHIALQLFRDNNVRLKILSGDAIDSVQATLHRVGWNAGESDCITGAALEKLSDAEFESAVKEKSVFARLKPEQKQKIIRQLNKSQRTAMIGDGVNDVPAVKEATLGIAMEEGSAITKEVADIVLLKNKFSVLPKIFEEGRIIMNSVSAIAKLYLTKNLIVLLLGVVTIALGTVFPLTPRRSGLLAIIGVSLPVYFITAFNKKTTPSNAFFTELFAFIGASLIATTGASYLTEFLVGLTFEHTAVELQMSMLSALVALCVANAYWISTQSNPEKQGVFLKASAVIMFVYAFLTQTEWTIFPINVIKAFYEIENFRWQLWGVIGFSSALGIALLFALHRLAERVVKNALEH